MPENGAARDIIPGPGRRRDCVNKQAIFARSKKRSRGTARPLYPCAREILPAPGRRRNCADEQTISARKGKRRQKTESTKETVGQRTSPKETNETSPTGVLKTKKSTAEKMDFLAVFFRFPRMQKHPAGGCKLPSPWGWQCHFQFTIFLLSHDKHISECCMLQRHIAGRSG